MSTALNLVETLIDAAQAHGEDSDPDMEVGDLQVALRAAWAALPEHAQRKVFAALWDEAEDWHPAPAKVEAVRSNRNVLVVKDHKPACSCGSSLLSAWESCGRKYYVTKPDERWLDAEEGQEAVGLTPAGETDDGDSDSLHLYCSDCNTTHYLAEYPDIAIGWE